MQNCGKMLLAALSAVSKVQYGVKIRTVLQTAMFGRSGLE
jgi:hypothetical protein